MYLDDGVSRESAPANLLSARVAAAKSDQLRDSGLEDDEGQSIYREVMIEKIWKVREMLLSYIIELSSVPGCANSIYRHHGHRKM